MGGERGTLARRGKRVAIVQGSANQKQFLRIGRMVQILHVLVSPVRARIRILRRSGPVGNVFQFVTDKNVKGKK